RQQQQPAVDVRAEAAQIAAARVTYAGSLTSGHLRYGRRMRSASRCASFIACSGFLVPVSAACSPWLSALVTRWLSWVESSATENSSWSRATTAGGNPAAYLRIVTVSQACGRTATYPVSMPHCAARSADVIHLTNFSAACCCAGVDFLNR